MKLLVVEDEKDLNSAIKKHLKINGYSVDTCFNGKEALEFINVTEYDGIILDIMMPIMNGYEFLKNIRAKNIQTPVLFLTAKDTIEDLVFGLDSGADDYIVKPFEFDELLARLRVMNRRVYGLVENEIKIDDIILNISKKKITRSNIEIDLTSKEYEIFEFLMQNKDHIMTREQIQNHVWDFDYEGASNLIDVLIKNIRKKINLNNSNPVIITKRGIGYVIKTIEKD
ncbi:MAG: response regulator transcription factor [Spirochaetaceae bacterium]|nr:response regulator transcription factor [Spirochaetaceae bacterium]